MQKTAFNIDEKAILCYYIKKSQKAVIRLKKNEDIEFSDKSFPLRMRKFSTSFKNDTGFSVQAIHEAIEVKYFYEGDSTLLVGDKTVYAEAGDIVIINPYEFHTTVDCGKNAPGRYHLFMIGIDFFDGVSGADLNLRNLIFGKHTNFKTQFKNCAEIRGILDRIVATDPEKSGAGRLKVFGLMAEFFAWLLENGVETGRSSSDEDILHYYSVIEPAIRMIRDEYSTHFTVDTLACACNISKFHFCRIFKSIMGVTSIQYLNAYRLKLADTLLANTDLQIGEIATMTGFEDASYFARIYKKQFGRSPKQAKSN